MSGRRDLARRVAGLVVAAVSSLAAAPIQPAQMVPIPEPVYEGVDPAVAEQLRALRREVEEAATQSGGATPVEVAARLGDLGGLYYFYNFAAPATAALTNARALTPRDFRWPYLLAVVEQAAGDVENAAAAFEEALALRPIYVPALVHLGEARLAQHRLDDAADLFERALAVNQGCAAARFGLGRVAAERGDHAAAAEHFAAVVELQPAATSVRYPLAQAYRALGRVDDAKAQLAAVGNGRVVLPDPVLQRIQGLATGSSVHFMRGRRALRRGDYGEALTELRQAEEADPGNVPVLRALGLALHDSGDLAGAVAQYRKAVETEPANPLNQQDLALALLDTGANAEAVERFGRALDLDPAYAEAHLGMGIALGRLGRPDAALPHLARALELDPTSTPTRFERAMALLRLRRGDEATAELQAVVAADPAHAAARVNLAALLEGRGDDDGAAHEAAAALDLGPPGPLSARARLILGRVAERRGEPAKAAEQYGAAVALDPRLPPARFRLASAQAAAGDLAAAAQSYHAALGLAPGYRPARLALASILIRTGRFADARDRLAEGLTGPAGGRPGAGADAGLSRALALLLAGCRDPAVRDLPRALELSRDAYAAAPGTATGEVFALALAANGRFEEAATAQGRLVATLEAAGSPDQAAAAGKRLERYQAGQPVLAPWEDDPSMLDPVALPVPQHGGGDEQP